MLRKPQNTHKHLTYWLHFESKHLIRPGVTGHGEGRGMEGITSKSWFSQGTIESNVTSTVLFKWCAVNVSSSFHACVLRDCELSQFFFWGGSDWCICLQIWPKQFAWWLRQPTKTLGFPIASWGNMVWPCVTPFVQPSHCSKPKTKTLLKPQGRTVQHILSNRQLQTPANGSDKGDHPPITPIKAAHKDFERRVSPVKFGCWRGSVRIFS